SSRDDANDEDKDDEDEEEEEEEHLAPANSTTVIPIDELVFPPEGTEPIIPSSGCPTQIQTLRIASTQALIDAVTAALPSPTTTIISIHTTTCSRYGIGESSTARPMRGRGIDYGFVSTVDTVERRQGIKDVGYGIRDTWVNPAEAVPEIAPMTVGEVNSRVTKLAELHKHDT
ncbi:hypothetical protein Tco_0253820, partial [Tanacetum coccineum]